MNTIQFPQQGFYLRDPRTSTDIYVESYGSDVNPTLVLTHGILQSSESWHKQVQTLSERYHLVIYDLPWHNFSGPSYPDTQENDIAGFYASALNTIVHAYGLQEKGFIHVGWSYGCVIFRNYLLTYGAAGVQGMILVDGALDLADFQGNPDFAQVDALFEPADTTTYQRRTNALLYFVQHLWYHRPAKEEYLMALGYNAQASLNVSASWQTQTDGDIIGLLQQQSFPILALYGAKDVIFPTAVIERIAQQYPRCELQVYPSCGHSPQQEIPGAFNNRVLTFADAYLSHHLPTKV